MPAVSFYLNEKTLDAVRAKSKLGNIPASQIIREAIESYLSIEEKREARKRVLNCLTREKPLGGAKGWERLHRERTEADAGRG